MADEQLPLQKTHKDNSIDTLQSLHLPENNAHKFRPRVIKCCTAVLLTLIIGVLLVQSCFNWAVIIEGDHIASCPASNEESQYLLLPVNSTYILPLQDNKDGVSFAFTSDEDTLYYDIAFKASGNDRREFEPTSHFFEHVQYCSPTVCRFDRVDSCYIVRYWPPHIDIHDSKISCPSANDLNLKHVQIRVVWKWFRLEVETSSNKYKMAYECSSVPNLSDYPLCDNENYNLNSAIKDSRPSPDHQIVVIRLCSEAMFNFEASFYETYQQLTVDTDEAQYTMGLHSNNTNNLTIPLKGNEHNIEIRSESSQIIEPLEIRFNYIHHDTVSITEEQTTTIPIKYTMYINATIPIILVIIVLILFCCTTCCKTK